LKWPKTLGLGTPFQQQCGGFLSCEQPKNQPVEFDRTIGVERLRAKRLGDDAVDHEPEVDAVVREAHQIGERELWSEFLGEHRRIRRAHLKRDEGAHIPENRVAPTP
jgi:hypothetical protein